MEEVDAIKELFHVMDTNKKGNLTIEELKTGLHLIGHHVPDIDVHMLMEAVGACRVSQFLPGSLSLVLSCHVYCTCSFLSFLTPVYLAFIINNLIIFICILRVFFSPSLYFRQT